MDLSIDKFSPERFGLITGSKCSVLFPKKSSEVGQNTYAKELAKQKYFRYYDEVSTWQMEHGNFSEHEAFEYFQSRFSKTIQKGYFKKDGEFGGSCDAIDTNYGVDFKCPTTLEGFLDYLFTGIDSQQFHQAQMYMFLFDRPIWKVAVYLTETLRMSEFGLKYPVPHDKRMIIVDVEREAGWDIKLKIAAPSLIRLRDQYYNVLVNQFGSKPDFESAKQKIEKGKMLRKKVGV